MTYIQYKFTEFHSLFHTTSEHNAGKIFESGKIFGTRGDKNDVCRRLGLNKVWTCAVPPGTSPTHCQHGSHSFRITYADLERIHPWWNIYRTRDYDGYRVVGRSKVFYNFFIIPDSIRLPARIMNQLVSCSGAPVQLLYVEDCFSFCEMTCDEYGGDDFTTVEVETITDEDRSFNIAIVCWNIEPDSALGIDTDTTTEDDDTMEGDTEDDRQENPGNNHHHQGGVEETESDTEAPDNDNISDITTDSLASKPFSWRPRYRNNGFSIVPAKFPGLPQSSLGDQDTTGRWKQHATHSQPEELCTNDSLFRMLRKRILCSVGTSRKALGLPLVEQEKDIRNFDQACRVALHHASRGSPLTLPDLEEWHTHLLQTNPQKAGALRSRSQARCGRRFFVRGEHVRSELSRFLESIPSEITSGGSGDEQLELAAWMLWSFLIIHPFADGNGRLGRLLVVWILARTNATHLIAPLCTPGERRAHYVRALRNVDASQGENMEPLVQHMRLCCAGSGD